MMGFGVAALSFILMQTISRNHTFIINILMYHAARMNTRNYFFVLFAVALLSSCSKDRKCWIVSDCLGNDTGSYCGSENEVKKFCDENETPGCEWSYRPE
jgi:hypothetical protein